MLVTGAWLVLLAASYTAVIHYKGFNAKHVGVTGQSRLTEEMVLRQAGIYPGENIFKVNLSVARQRLLTLPWIQKAEVVRELPDKIQIRIHEHEPMAIVDMNTKYLMNTEGDIFKHVGGEKDELPIISGLSPQDIQVAGRLPMKNESNPHKAVMNIIKLAKAPDSGLPINQIKRILVDREIGLTLMTSGAAKIIKLGYDNYPDKIIRLNQVLKYLNEKAHVLNVDTIDLHNINRIVVKPAAQNAHA